MFDLSVPWWELVLRSVVVYFAVLFLLRITGKRQIGELSPFDLILLLLISEAVQNSIVGKDSSLIGGLIAVFTLIGVNYVMGVATTKNKRLEKMMEGRPQVLIHEGHLFEDVIRTEKLTRKELDSALRQEGYFDLKEVKLALLETNGTISVQGYDRKKQE
ncbi:MAG TPA: YetF domain-containing protein [Methylophilaceae bacterium]|nr:YetF domain-containing protein [Methylophilaceae bacterium]